MNRRILNRENVFLRVVLLIVFLFTSTGFAADVSSGFDSANKLYEEGKFSEATAAYEQLIQSGTTSSAIYFNLGNAYFKSGELGHAIAAYRDAQTIAPRDPDVRANLEFVRARVQNPTLTPNRWQQFLAVLTVNEWAMITAAVLWIWLALLIVLQFRPQLKPSLRMFLWCGTCALVALAFFLGAASSSSSMKTAIVIAPDAVIHNGPLDATPTRATIHDGAEVSVIDTKNDWLQVQVDSQRVGWIKREQVVLTSGI
jgi:tetratricopeptide (TPR) repeat protein